MLAVISSVAPLFTVNIDELLETFILNVATFFCTHRNLPHTITIDVTWLTADATVKDWLTMD